MFQRWLKNRKINRLRQQEQDLLNIISYERWRKADADAQIEAVRKLLHANSLELIGLGAKITISDRVVRPDINRVVRLAARS